MNKIIEKIIRFIIRRVIAFTDRPRFNPKWVSVGKQFRDDRIQPENFIPRMTDEKDQNNSAEMISAAGRFHNNVPSPLWQITYQKQMTYEV